MADSLIGPQGEVPGLVEEEGHRRERRVERKRGCEPCPAREWGRVEETVGKEAARCGGGRSQDLRRVL